jgi:hypothetical protein
MKLIATLRPWVVVAQLIAHLLLLGRLFSTGLNQTYKWFSLYILFETVRAIPILFISPRTTMYGYYYLVTQPISWCLHLLVILELVHLVLKNHAGIATFARRALTVGLSLSTVASLATLAFEIQQPTFSIISTYVLIERLILSTLLILLLLFTGFLVYFPVPVNRNTVIHTRIFACFFLFKTVLLIFRNIVTSEQAYQGLNALLQIFATACLLAWATLLSRSGEEIKSATSYRSNPIDEERLVAQLDAINRTLLSSAKKQHYSD